MRTRISILVLLCAMCFGLAGCNFGQVEQGRCVAYNEKDQTFTMVLDVKHDAQNPDYSGGFMTYKLPVDPKEMGPEPVPGGRVHFDIEKKQVVICTDPVAGKLETLNVEFVDVQKGIKANNPAVKGKKFPVIDKEKGQITEYSKRLQSLVTFKATPAMLAMPANTWNAGDECRIYYKPSAKHQVLRFMNVTRTNIFKK